MQVFSINSYSFDKCPKPSFKAAYPVNYFVREAGGKFAPAAKNETIETLQRKIVSLLNLNSLALKKGKTRATDPKTIAKKLEEMQIIQDGVAKVDRHYQNCKIARSFYSGDAKVEGTNLSSMSYLITGRDVESFENQYVKNIGRAKKGYRKGVDLRTAEQNDATAKYRTGGLQWVKDVAKQFSYNNEQVSANFLFEAVRNKSGEVKEYKPIGVKYLTQSKLEEVLKKMRDSQ